MPTPRSLLQKLWDAHIVLETDEGNCLLYIDRHLLYEVTSPQAFEGLRQAGRRAWRPETSIATADHNVPTLAEEREGGAASIRDPLSRQQVQQLEKNAKDFHIPLFTLGDSRQGIIHVIGPEQGASLPGMSIVAGDSHTSTHGAFAALAFGVGTSEVEHVLTTQCLWMKRMKSMRIHVSGQLPVGTFAKDLILSLIGTLGSSGANGHAIEFEGSAIRSLSMEGRMTLCNMAIEAGARVGLIAVDETTINYLQDRPLAPKGALWHDACAYWRTLTSDPGAPFDQAIHIDANTLRPMVTWGTSPDMVTSIDGIVPDPALEPSHVRREAMERSLHYMALRPGQRIRDIRPDRVFIGSCTNARLEDLRAAANVVQGKRVNASIRQALVVPGSGLVKQQAESEGLHHIFTAAGFEWREPGCSMCLGMNSDRLQPEERCASTSNRNFEGRQGAEGRTHLVSPAVAAATAIAGCFTLPVDL